MWGKYFRLSLITAVYQEMFWRGIPSVELDLDVLHIVNTVEEKRDPSDKNVEQEQKEIISTEDLSSELQKCLALEKEYVDVLKEYLADWAKTYDLVKAVLFVFMLEKAEATEAGEDPSELVGKYIKITQDLVGGKSTGLVHAILSKMTGGRVKSPEELLAEESKDAEETEVVETSEVVEEK